ncbi:molybdenum cofactor guanylyltransferase [Marinifilum caeruleilacunae]|uniref:Probable molybdenum cofactor guanylyltransferase n=1 Tax=Marinifilum caeruleilacunae TaxID=2499076 RepID=A0ABX1WSK9_9BACT|nr:molybdenum cofactor guanylyltransferase [Marinifilum caeruleilacunae]NOU58981.1 molybdenum cofactor guanylyltransferase [Marinifilum caeruleilacunae]
MNRNKNIAGIVLSGGKSSRMGTEKGLVDWNGKALIEYSIGCFKELCNIIVISSNNHSYDDFGLQIIADEIKDCGPIGGIYSCMKAIQADYYLVISCDVPKVPSQLFADLLKNIHDADVIYARDEFGKKQPLVAIYKSSCRDIIERELRKGNYKMMKLLQLFRSKEFPISDQLNYYSEGMLSNVNSPDELKNL